MDKRQKQVFRLVTLLPAFPAAASGTRGEQVLRLTAAGPLPDLTGFPMKLVAALLPAQDGKRCLTCQHRVFVGILQHFEIIVKNYKSAPRQAICQSPRQFWAGGIFESADHSGCVVFHNFPACRGLFRMEKAPFREAFLCTPPTGYTARVRTVHPVGNHPSIRRRYPGIPAPACRR